MRLESLEEEWQWCLGVWNDESIHPNFKYNRGQFQGMINDKSKFRIRNGNMTRFFALVLPLVAAAVIASLSYQAAYAQITPAQQKALASMVATGYTNHYSLLPPRSWCSTCNANVTVPYSINLGQLIAMAPNQPKTSLDVIIAPTQHQSAPGVLTMQIPRYLLDSKNAEGADTPFRVTLDGHGLAWQQLQQTNTYRVLGLYFTSQNGYLEIFGTQGAVTKAFPTNH